jgi:hypothetical protein
VQGPSEPLFRHDQTGAGAVCPVDTKPIGGGIMADTERCRSPLGRAINLKGLVAYSDAGQRAQAGKPANAGRIRHLLAALHWCLDTLRTLERDDTL